jgi:hypothetical protein
MILSKIENGRKNKRTFYEHNFYSQRKRYEKVSKKKKNLNFFFSNL